MFSARIMAQAKGLAIRTEKENKAGETFITVLGSNRGGGFHFKQTFFFKFSLPIYSVLSERYNNGLNPYTVSN